MCRTILFQGFELLLAPFLERNVGKEIILMKVQAKSTTIDFFITGYILALIQHVQIIFNCLRGENLQVDEYGRRDE